MNPSQIESSSVRANSSSGIGLSIVIVGKNNKELLDQCLASILRNPPSERFEIIYVDNASEKGCTEFIKNKYPEIILIENPSNMGFQKANNQGLKISRGKYIVLLNNDILIKPQTFDNMMKFMKRQKKAGATSPKCLYPNGRLQWSVSLFPTPFRLWLWICSNHKSLRWIMPFCRSQKINSKQTQRQDYAYGACLMVKRDVFEKVGYMDEDFYMACGEVAWCERIKRRGWAIFYIAEAEIIHYEGASRNENSLEKLIDWYSAHRRLLYRYRGLSSGFLVDGIFILHLIIKIMVNFFLDLMKFSFINTKYWLQIFRGIYLISRDKCS